MVLRHRRIAHPKTRAEMFGEEFHSRTVRHWVGLRQILHRFHNHALPFHIAIVPHRHAATTQSQRYNGNGKNFRHTEPTENPAKPSSNHHSSPSHQRASETPQLHQTRSASPNTTGHPSSQRSTGRAQLQSCHPTPTIRRALAPAGRCENLGPKQEYSALPRNCTPLFFREKVRCLYGYLVPLPDAVSLRGWCREILNPASTRMSSSQSSSA